MDTSENTAYVALIVILLVLSLATIQVALRIYTRIYLLKQLGWDDYSVVVTLMFAIGTGGAVLSTIPYGLGRHTSTLPVSIIPKYLFPFWMSIVLYNTTLALIKLTFIFQYYRLLAVHKMKKVIWIMGIIIMAWAISQILVVILSCNPVAKFWRADLPGSCIPNLPFWYINAAGNIATDLAIFIMPLPVLNKLQLRRKQKYFLIAIFSLGFFTCAISLIRLAYLKQGPDFTYDNVPTSCWSVSELCCGITCACLPTLKPLVSKLKPHWLTSYARSRAARNTGTGKLHYGGGGGGKSGGKSSGGGNENGTELKNTSHRSRTTTNTSNTTHESVKTLSSTLKSKNYTMIEEVDVEQGLHMSPSPSHRHPPPERLGMGAAAGGGGGGGLDGFTTTGKPMGWPIDDSKQHHHHAGAVVVTYEVPKQSMPAVGLSKQESKAMEVLGMTGGSVSTHVSSGRRTSIPPGAYHFYHPDGSGSGSGGSHNGARSFAEGAGFGAGEAQSTLASGRIEVKRSVTVETILTPTSTTGMRYTTPREF